MGRLKDVDVEMHELPDSEKEIQEAKNMRAYVLGFEIGQEAERDRIIKILEAEKKRTGLGFIQYGVLLQKIGE
jgi:hypothetical protein